MWDLSYSNFPFHYLKGNQLWLQPQVHFAYPLICFSHSLTSRWWWWFGPRECPHKPSGSSCPKEIMPNKKGCEGSHCWMPQWQWWQGVVTNGTDSYIMHTWYVGQARLFLISLSNLATPLITYGVPCITLLCSTFIATLLHIWRRPYPYFRISFIH